MSRFQTLTLSITTLAPLHIGGQEGDLLPTEFATLKGKVYVVSEERLATALEEKGLLEDFSRAVVQAGKAFSLEAYLRGRGLLTESFLTSVARYSARSSVPPKPTLRPFIRDGLDRPFIPGSAVKGALRVAVLYQLLKRLDLTKRQEILDGFVKQRLETFRADSRNRFGWFRERFKREFDQELDQRLFQRFRLLPTQGKFDPHTDLFRAVKVSDAKPFDKESLVVEEIKVYSLGAGEKRWSIFAECLPPQTTFELMLTLDQDILADFARHNPRLAWNLPFEEVKQLLFNPLRPLATLAQDVLMSERRLFKNDGTMKQAFSFTLPDGHQQEPNLRLGWGGGLLSTTVDLLLPDALRQELRDTLFVSRRGFPAPKSRKLVKGGTTLGWAVATVKS